MLTVLLYMNPSWESSDGRLRLLRGPDRLDAAVVEVPPAEGTLLAFRNGPTAWHGHTSVSGPRCFSAPKAPVSRMPPWHRPTYGCGSRWPPASTR